MNARFSSHEQTVSTRAFIVLTLIFLALACAIARAQTVDVGDDTAPIRARYAYGDRDIDAAERFLHGGPGWFSDLLDRENFSFFARTPFMLRTRNYVRTPLVRDPANDVGSNTGATTEDPGIHYTPFDLSLVSSSYVAHSFDTGKARTTTSFAAGSAVWTGATNNLWSTGTNWNPSGTVPGSADTATFNAASANTTISLSAIAVKTILFDTASAAAYTMGSGGVGAQTLTISDSGAITVNSTVANGELFNAAIVLGTSRSATSTITFTNDSAQLLTIAGNISPTTGGTGSGATKTLSIGGAGNGVISGAISGTASGNNAGVSVVKTGNGAWTLSGSTGNAYGGSTTVIAGELDLNKSSGNAVSGALTIGDGSGTDTLKLLASNQIADTSAVQIDGTSGVLNLNGNSDTIGSLADRSGGSGSSGIVSLGAGTLTISGSATTTFSGGISGSGGVTRSGTGTLTLSGTNGYSGTTSVTGGTLTLTGSVASSAVSVSGGTLNLNSNNALSANPTVALSGGTLNINNATALGTGTLTISGGAIDSSVAGITLANNNAETWNGDFSFTGTNSLNLGTGAVSLGTASGTGRTVTVNANTLTIAGAISNGTTATSLTKAGSGTLVLAGTNGYTGGTTLSAGTLQLAGSGTLGATNGALAVNGGTVDLNGTNQSIGNLTGSGGTILDGATGTNVTLTIGSGDTGGGSYAGVLANGNGTLSLTKTGSGTSTLGGANTYTGDTNINAGTLSITGMLASTGAVSVNTATGNATLAGTGSAGNVTLADSTGSFVATISPGTTTSSVGTLSLSSLNVGIGANLAFDLAGTTANPSSDFLSITNAAIFNGASTLTLSIASGTTYASSYTLMTAGSLVGDLPTVIPPSSAGRTTFSLGTSGNSLVLTPTVTIADLTWTGADATHLWDTNTTINWSGGTNANNHFFAGDKVNFDDTAQSFSVVVSGQVAPTSVTVNNSTHDYTISGATASDGITGSTSIIKNGTATLTLSSANTYTGGTIINAGTLALGASNVLADNGPVTVSGGTFDIGANSDTVGAVIVSSGAIAGTSGVLTGSSFTLQGGTISASVSASGAAGYALQSGTVSGVLGGSGAVAKTTAGTVTLSGNVANTYSGGTSVNAGELDLNKTAANGAIPGNVTIGSAGTLKLLGSDQISNSSIVTMSNSGAAVFNLNGFSETIRDLTDGDTTGVSGASILLGGGSALTFGNTQSFTFSGVISGTGSIVKAGTSATGIETLNGANTFSGGTTVTAGGIALGLSDSVSGGVIVSGPVGTGTLALSTGTTLRSSTTDARTLENNVTFTGTITLGDGTNSGVLTFDSAGLATPSTVSLVGNTTLTLASAVTINNAVTGSFSLTKAGGATLTLSGANSYTGATNVNAGTLTLTGTLGNTAVTVGAGTLQLNGAGAISQNTLTVNNASAVVTENTANALSGTAALTQSAGSVVLSQANNTSGNTSLTGGTLTLSDTAALASSNLSISGGTLQLRKDTSAGTFSNASTTVAGTTTINVDRATAGSGVQLSLGAVSMGAFTLNITGANSYSLGLGSLTLTGAATFNPTSANISIASATGTNENLTLDGTATGNSIGAITTGLGTLTKSNTSTWTLSGTNTYTGGTTVSGGTLQLAGSGTLGATSGGLTINGGTLDLNGTSQAIGNFSGSGGTILNNATGTSVSLTIGTGAGAGTYGGVIADNSAGNGTVGLVKTGTGIITLTGANTYSGGTTVSGGTLTFTGSGTLGSTSGALTVNGGSVDLNSVSQTVGALNGTGGMITNAGNGNATLTVGNGDASGSYSGAIADSGNGTKKLALTKTGTGTETLSGNNTYSLATTVSQGVLNIQNANALGGTAVGTTVNAGATLQLQGGVTFAAEGLTISGSGASGQNGALVNVNGTNNYAGLLALGSASAVSSDAGTLNLTNAGTISGATFGLTLTGSGNGSVSSIIGTTSGALTKSGTGTWSLLGANTYTGGTTISAGTLALSGTGTIGGSSGSLTVNGGMFDLGGTSVGVGNFTGSGGTVVNNGGANSTLTIGNGNGTGGNFAGVLADHTTGSNSLALTKLGTGTITLSGGSANTYTGATTVTAGELDLNKSGVNAIAGDGNTATNDVTINGGTLKWLASNQVANDATIAMSSGSLSLNGQTETILNFTNSGGTFSTGVNGHLIGTGASITWSGGTNTINDGATVEDSHIVITGGTNTVQGGATGGVLKLNSGGVGLEMTGSTLTLNSDNNVAGKLLLDGNVITNASAATATIANALSNTNPGTIDLDGGTRTFTVADGAAATDLSVSAQIANGALTKAGAGTLSLSGTNTYTGTTRINAGTLVLGNAANTLSDSDFVQLVAGTLSLGANSDTVGNVEMDTGSISGSGTLTATNFDFRSGTVNANLAGTAAMTKSSTGGLFLSGNNTYTGGTTINEGDVTFSNGSAFGSGTITFGPNATQSMSLMSTAAVSVGNNIVIADFSTNPDSATGRSATIGSSSNAASGANAYTGSVTINNSLLNIKSSSPTTNPLTFSGAISGAGGIAINPSGTISPGAVKFAGNNTYSGNTSVAAGTLLVTGGLSGSSTNSGTGTGNVTVTGSGTTLSGGSTDGATGTILGSVSVASGSNLAPGTSGNGTGSTAVLQVGAVTLSSGSFFNVDLNSIAVGTGYDQLFVTGVGTGTVNLGGLLASNLVVTAGSNLQVGQQFTIINNAGIGPVVGTFAQGALTGASNNGDFFAIDYAGGDGNDIVLTVTAIPEPSTWGGAALACAAIAFGTRRKVRAAKR